MTGYTDQDNRSDEIAAYDTALCEPMSLQQLNQYHATVVGSVTWLMAASPELAEELRDAMKRAAESVLRR